jgi:D-xylonolactonase
MKIELIADYACLCGEGPLWHPEEGAVYWQDIPKGRMFRYDLATGEHKMVYEGEEIGGTTLQADGSILCFMSRGTVRVWRDGAMAETIIEEIPEERETRFNDVIAAPGGQVFCGTMPTKERLGRLYRLDTDGTLTIVREEVTCANGMGYTPDRRQMYFTDSMRHDIYLFDYDQASGEMTNERVFVHTPEDEGIPDGMTVDAEGYVWSARWDGGCLVRYAPDGTEDRRIPLPAKKVSCPLFGGPDYSDIYVTTAGGFDKASEGEGAGALFRITAGIKGVPEFRSRIKL